MPHILAPGADTAHPLAWGAQAAGAGEQGQGSVITYDIDLVLGASWPERGPLHVTYLVPGTPSPAPGIPAGYLARAQWRQHPNSSLVLLELLPVIDYAAGSFDLSLTSEQTPLLGTLSHWGLQLESPDGLVQVPLAEGRTNGALKTVRRP
jgi:hypothetical protein